MMPNETAVEYLTSAPRICQSKPMHWTFLDGPADGTVMLTWQPTHHMGTNFASDGYIWADAEQAYTFEARGYVCYTNEALRETDVRSNKITSDC